MATYLDDQGLRHLWSLLKEKFNNKVDKEAGKGLSEEDFTTRLKTKLEGISEGANQYTHPAYDAKTGKPEANQTPAFGATFTISQVVSDGFGHVDKMNDRTVKIPDTLMKKATSSAAGDRGLVPAPQAGDQGKFLRGDGEWAEVVTQDRKVEMILNKTTKAYLLGTTEEPTRTSQSTTAIADTGVYLDTEAGSLTATNFYGGGANLENLKADKITSGTLAAARLPDASSSSKGAMSAADKTKLDDFQTADKYALKTDVTSMYRHKGSVQNEDALPTSGNVAGDVYNVIYKKSDGTTYGMNYVWTGTTWDALGEIFVINSIPNSEIDGILNT